MIFRRARQQAAALSSLMSQTRDVVVCFDFTTPIDLTAESAEISARLRQTRVVEASKTFARYFGYKNREEIIGKDMMELVGQSIPEWFFGFGNEVAANDYRSIERIVKIPLGDQTVYMRAHMENIFENDLLVRQWVTLRDVTKEELNRIKLETQQQMQSLTLDAIGLESFELSLPITADSTLPKWWDQIHELDKEAVIKDFMLFSENPEVRLRTSFRVIDFDGATAWKECWAIKRQSDDQDNPDSAIGLLLDRSDEKALEDKILSMQRLEGLGVLAGGIAHDFNNLLVSIVGSLDLVQLQHPELAEALAPSNHAAEQLAALCQQLLTYAGQGTVEHDKLDMVALIHDFTDVLKLSIHRNASISFALEETGWIKGDKNQIRQIILNLVKNASDARGKHPETSKSAFARQSTMKSGRKTFISAHNWAMENTSFWKSETQAMAYRARSSATSLTHSFLPSLLEEGWVSRWSLAPLRVMGAQFACSPTIKAPRLLSPSPHPSQPQAAQHQRSQLLLLQIMMRCLLLMTLRMC